MLLVSSVFGFGVRLGVGAGIMGKVSSVAGAVQIAAATIPRTVIRNVNEIRRQ